MRPQIIREETSEPKTHHIWLLISLVFVGIVGYLVYTSFYNSNISFPISSNLVKSTENETSANKYLSISAELNLPEQLSIEGEIKKIEIKTTTTDQFTFGNQQFDIKNKKTSIVIDIFDGSVQLDKNKISQLKGQAQKIFVEGIPITSSQPLDLSLKNSEFSTFRLTDFYIDSISYKTSGKIILSDQKILINLDKEDFDLNQFSGSLEIKNNKLYLNGIAEKSTLLGYVEVKPN